MTTIQELLVRINADTGSVRRELDRLNGKIDQTSTQGQRNFQRLGTAARAVGAAIAAAFAAAGVRQIVQLTRASLEFANALSDQADVVGLSAEALQEYRFAASSVGVVQRALDTGLQRFARRVGEAAQGTGVLAEVFDQYGIAVRDNTGEMRTQEQILADFADAVARAESEQEALRLTFKAFDREGARLVNLFRQGSDAIEGLRQEARDLGAVLSDELVAKAAVANTRLGQLETALQTSFRAGLLDGVTRDFGTFEALLRDLIPVAQEVGQLVAELGPIFARLLRQAAPIVQQLIQNLITLAENADQVKVVLGAIVGLRLGSSFGPLGAAIGAVAGALLAAADNAELFAGEADGAVQRGEDLAAAMAAIEAEARGATGEVKRLAAATRELAVEQARQAEAEALQQLDRALADQREIVMGFGPGGSERFRDLRRQLEEARRLFEAGEITGSELSAQVQGLYEGLGGGGMRSALTDFEALERQAQSARDQVALLRETITRLTRTPIGEGITVRLPVRVQVTPGEGEDTAPGGDGGNGGGGRATEEVSALERALAAVAERAAQARQEISQIGASAGEVERLRTEAELLAAAQEDGLAVTPELRAVMQETATASGEAAQRLADMTAAALLIRDAQTPQEAYADEVERVTALLPALIERLGDTAAAYEVVRRAVEAAREASEEAADANEDIRDFAKDASRTMIEGFYEAARRGEGLLRVLNQVAERLASMAVERLIFDPLFDDIGRWIDGIDLGGIFGGARLPVGGLFARGGVMTPGGPLPLRHYAGGGIVNSPQVAVFGEGRRPEAYVPLPDGRSIPVTMTGGAGGAGSVQHHTHYHIDARGADASAIAKLERALVAVDKSVEGRAVAATKRAADRYGDYAKAVGRRRP